MQPKPAAAAPAKELGKPVTPPCQVLRVRFVTDGPTLAAAGTDGLVYRYDLSRGEPVALPPLPGHKGWVTGLATHGEFAYSADSWGKLHGRALVEVNSHPNWEVADAHDGWVRMVAVSPDGALLATCGKDGFVRLWNATDGKKLGEVNAAADVLALAFAPDGKTVLAGDLFGALREFEVPAGKVVRSYEVKELYRLDRIQDVGGVRGLLFDAAGKTLFVAGAEPKTGGFVQCVPLLVAFDRESGKRLHQWKGANDNEGYVTDLAWHPDGYVAGTTSGQPGQGKVFFWRPGAEPPFFVAAKPNCHSVALTPDGRLMAAATTNANSAGNGRPKGKDGEYPANDSPIQLWQVQQPG